MGDGKVNARQLVIKEGMTPEDVKGNPNATPQQKAYANVFDSDGIEGYSAREAAVFNSTTITDNGKKGITLWTSYQDGSKKGTTVTGDVASFKYAPEGDVKPFTKKVSVPQNTSEKNSAEETMTASYTENNTSSSSAIDTNTRAKVDPLSFSNETGSLSMTDTHANSKTKSIYTKDSKSIEFKEFYENGKPKTERKSEWNGSDYIVRQETEYYPNGKVKSKYENDDSTKTLKFESFQESGKLSSKKICNGMVINI